MKKLLLSLGVAALLSSCAEPESDIYTGRVLEFQLYKSSDYEFQGTLSVKEKIGGTLEMGIDLSGPSATVDYQFPAHLHFGTYEQADAPIAYLLSPIDAKTLESVTEIGQLSDGSALDFEGMKTFEGHVKIHLANDGPDYQVILVAGNIGPSAQLGFNKDQMAVCGNSY